MDQTEFDNIWDIIQQQIKKCYDEADKSFVQNASLRIKDLKKYRKQLKELYFEKRKWLKSEYLPYDDIPRLDFHKLGSIICRCIIGNKPFLFDDKYAQKYVLEEHRNLCPDYEHNRLLRFQIDNIYINYKLAFLVAEAVAFNDMKFWTNVQIDVLSKKNEKDSELLISVYRKFLEKNRISKLVDYEQSSYHDTFYDSMVTCLMKSDILLRDFDYLTFSALLFQWQQYTKLKMFIQIIIENGMIVCIDDLMKSHETSEELAEILDLNIITEQSKQ